MPFHGKNTYVGIDNAAGTLVDVSAFSRSASPKESIDTAETTNFGQNDKTYIVGLADETVSIGGTFETAFYTQLRAVKAAQQAGTQPTCTVRIGVAGNTTGRPFSERECIITSLEVSAATGDLVTLSAEFQRTGATTDGTFS